MNEEKKRVLIIGAGGFIGGFMAAEALRRGYDTTVGVRCSTSRKYLTDSRLTFLTLDYDNPEALEAAFAGSEPWDWIVYNLGATRALRFGDFNRINFEYLRNTVEALRRADRVPAKFLYMSSLSAVGPGDEKTYTPLRVTDVPDPNTRYGLSKMKAETFLRTAVGFPWIIFRPTGVYGPHEQDYLMAVKAIAKGFDFGVGMRRQLLTFIYVEDLARAAFDALEKAPTGRTYIISEDRAYTQTEFRNAVKRAVGRRMVVPVRLPLWMARIACLVSEKIAAGKGKTATLNTDKYKILRQRNWSCDISEAKADFGFEPRVDLAEGLRRVVEADKQSAKP